MAEAGHDVKIFWHSAEASINMKEAGEEYSNIVEVPFTFAKHS